MLHRALETGRPTASKHQASVRGVFHSRVLANATDFLGCRYVVHLINILVMFWLLSAFSKSLPLARG